MTIRDVCTLYTVQGLNEFKCVPTGGGSFIQRESAAGGGEEEERGKEELRRRRRREKRQGMELIIVCWLYILLKFWAKAGEISRATDESVSSKIRCR